VCSPLYTVLVAENMVQEYERQALPVYIEESYAAAGKLG